MSHLAHILAIIAAGAVPVALMIVICLSRRSQTRFNATNHYARKGKQCGSTQRS